MIFEMLEASAEAGELLLVQGGLCRYHLRQDGQLTIYEILVLPKLRGKGIGKMFLEELRQVPDVTSIFAKCPSDLYANGWYQRMGFQHDGIETSSTGREIQRWRLPL